MRAYSQDIRDRVLSGLGRRERISDLCRRLEVGRQFIYDVRDRLVEDGERSSRRRGGYRTSRLLGMEGVIGDWLKADPGLTLQALCDRLKRDQQIEIRIHGLWNQMNHWGLSLKKNPARQRARAAGRTAGAAGMASATSAT